MPEIRGPTKARKRYYPLVNYLAISRGIFVDFIYDQQGPIFQRPIGHPSLLISSPAWRTILMFFDINRRCTDLQWHNKCHGLGKNNAMGSPTWNPHVEIAVINVICLGMKTLHWFFMGNPRCPVQGCRLYQTKKTLILAPHRSLAVCISCIYTRED